MRQAFRAHLSRERALTSRNWHLSGGWLPGLRRAGPSAPLDECGRPGSDRVACVSVAYVDARVESWFRRRTSRAADWPVARVLAAKGPTRVSVVLPALDE